MRDELRDRLLRIAQDTAGNAVQVDDKGNYIPSGRYLVDAADMLDLKAVIKVISDEAVAHIQQVMADTQADRLRQPITGLKDEDGGDLELQYLVTLSYVVGVGGPCDEKALAENVQSRIEAGHGVQAGDIIQARIIGINRI